MVKTSDSLEKWTELLLLQLLLFLQRFLYFFSFYSSVCYVCVCSLILVHHITQKARQQQDADGVLYVIVSFLMMITSLFLLQRYALLDKFAFPFWHKIYCCSGGWISFHKAKRENIMVWGALCYYAFVCGMALAWLEHWASASLHLFLMEYYKRHKRNQTVLFPLFALLLLIFSSVKDRVHKKTHIRLR